MVGLVHFGLFRDQSADAPSKDADRGAEGNFWHPSRAVADSWDVRELLMGSIPVRQELERHHLARALPSGLGIAHRFLFNLVYLERRSNHLRVATHSLPERFLLAGCVQQSRPGASATG